MADCRAAVITEHNKPLEIQRVPIPALQPGALLVRLEVSTLCGTDVHRWHGPLGGGDSLPIITGHEPCGIVEAINGERTDILGHPVKPGERVVWSYVACGSCYYCSVALQPCICRGRASWGRNRSDRMVVMQPLHVLCTQPSSVSCCLCDHLHAARILKGRQVALRLQPPPSCTACPGGAMPLYALRRAAAAGSRWALGPQPSPRARAAASGGVRLGGGAKMPFKLPIRYDVFLTSRVPEVVVVAVKCSW